MMTKEELRSAVDAIPHWYHVVELPHGIITPGWAPQHPEFYKLPTDLTGKRVLDVGAWDGFWAFEALRRGASEVVCIDDFSDTIHDGEKRDWRQLLLCRDALGYTSNDVWCEELSVYDVSEAALGHFDVVLLFGVFYHLRHGLLALEKLADVTKELLCIESAICDDYSPYLQIGGRNNGPVMEFFPTDEYGKNGTNWWCPTLRCLTLMVASVGFQNVASWKIENPTPPVECRGFVQGKR